MPPVGRDWSQEQLDALSAYLKERLPWQLEREPVPSRSGSAARWRAGSSPSTTSGSGSSTSRPPGLFFVAGGIMAELIRTQLMRPDQTIVTGSDYNQLVTIHGTTMIFLVVVPILTGLANFLVPLMIGAPRHGLPAPERALVLALSLRRRRADASFLAKGGAACAGWTSYAPLSTAMPGHGQDLWILSLHILGDLVADRSDQLHRHDPQHARAGHDLDAHPAVRLVDRGLRLAARARAADDRGRRDDAAARPPGRDALLRALARRPDPLPARLLVLRAPRGLHHDPAGDGDHLGDPPGLRTQADLRLQGDRALDGRDRLLLDARLGAPHVHGRAAELPERLLHAQLDGDRRARPA